MRILVTGAAGFIGAALCEKLLRNGETVYGCDNLNDYYDPELKQARLQRLQAFENFEFSKLDISDAEGLWVFFQQVQPQAVVHLAAQASVRYGLTHPRPYADSNLMGHFNVLWCCRQAAEAGSAVNHLLYASTSAVYGGNEKVPFHEDDDVSRPQSLYAATKRADELMTYSWCNMFGLKATAVRFFTVYGPWGRPDMSPMLFAGSMLKGEPVPLYNGGDLWRDFTYIDDVVEALVRLLPCTPAGAVAHEIYNIGNHQPVQMLEFVKSMEEVLGVGAQLDLREWPSTEVYKTYADTQKLRQAIGWAPATELRLGLQRFADWFVPYWQERM